MNATIKDSPNLSIDDIKNTIASEFYFTAADGERFARFGEQYALEDVPAALSKITFCVLILKNGYKITGVNHSSVSPENHNPELGRQLAYKDAFEKIWELEGYLLKDKLHIKQHWQTEYQREQAESAGQSKAVLQAGIDEFLDTRIPIINQLTELCDAIEKCGASPELTNAVTKASALREPISELVKQAVALGIGDGIVSVSYSNNGSLPTLNSSDEMPFKPECSSVSANGNCESVSSKRDERLDNRETAYMLTQLVNSRHIGALLRKKAEAKLSDFLDKLN